MDKKSTSWGKVSSWYDEMLQDSDSYQQKVVLPNLLRVLEIKKGDRVLDIGCGQGFFSREIDKFGGEVEGIDISPELIKIAKSFQSKNISYKVSSADQNLPYDDKYFDKAVAVLALQNIKDAFNVCYEVFRVLKSGGKFFIVLNHPAFRIPQGSDWGFDEEKKSQYRKIYEYMSEKKVEIVMNPGKIAQGKGSVKTYSFHRPLQLYFKYLTKAGFNVSRLEEWISHKESGAGPRKTAEDKARKEIPMFMMIQATKI